MTTRLFGLSGLDEYASFFACLKRLPHPIVHRFLVDLREHEMASGELERWIVRHAAQLDLMSIAAGDGDLTGVREAYARYRLLRRPIAFAMMALFGEHPTFLEDCLHIDGAEVLDASSGVVFVGTHFGPQTSLPFLLAASGRRLTTIMSAQERALIWSLLTTYCPETSSRINLIGVPDRAVLMKCLSRLRQGESVLVFMEFSESDLPSKTEASLFDFTLPAPEGPFLLAAAAGRPLVPVHVLHEDDFRMRLVVDEPVQVPRVRRHELGDVVQPFWRKLERNIRAHPEQWLGWEVLAKRFCADGYRSGSSPVAG